MGRRSSPWYRKHDGWWYATVRGSREKLAKGKASEKAAWKRFHELMAAPPADPEAGISLVALSEAHAEAAQGEVAESTFATYRKYIGPFMAHVGQATAAEDCRPHHIDAWLKAHPGWGPSTRRLATSVILVLFSWGKTKGHLKTNPMAEVKRPTAKPREIAMGGATLDGILGRISKRGRTLIPFLEFMRETGCRPSEAMGLEARYLDFEAATATFAGKTTRATGKLRTIHLTPAAVAICRPLCEAHPRGPIFRNSAGKPWTRGLLATRFAVLREQLGLPKGTCVETIRHGWITDALVAGVPIATVAELAGHSDTTMISRVYSKLNQRTDHLQEELAKVRPPSKT